MRPPQAAFPERKKNLTIHQAILHGERILGESGMDQPRWQSERILSVALRQPRSAIYAELGRELTASELTSFEQLLRKRASHYPLAYLEGMQDFYGRDFIVNPSVLIPRPETEEIIRAVLDLSLQENPWILDLGSGSGNIPVTLALELSGSVVFALERSAAAISILKKNVQGNVSVVQGNFYSAPFCSFAFDLVTANLPYVEQHEFQTVSPEIAWEPADALFVQSLEESYAAVMNQALRIMKQGGYLLMEFGFGQSERLKKTASLIEQLRFVDIRKDHQGISRVLILQKRP